MYPWLEKQSEFWQQQLNSSLGHVYLLLGADGIGINNFAKNMAKDLLCKSINRAACNNCLQCNLFNKNNHPDFFHVTTLEDKKNISIEQIRNLNKKLFTTSHQGGYKVAFIEQAENLNISSFNALLKTLEEPPLKTTIILTSFQKHKLPDTILSRCLKIDFTSPSLIEGANWLQNSLPTTDKALIEKSLKINWLAPLNAKSWLENKQFEQEQAWQDDLKILQANNISTTKIVAKWLKYEDPVIVFDYFYLWTVSVVRKAFYQQQIDFNPNWLVFQKMILQAKDVWYKNANKELILEAVCLAWQQHQTNKFNPNSKLFTTFNAIVIRGTQI